MLHSAAAWVFAIILYFAIQSNGNEAIGVTCAGLLLYCHYLDGKLADTNKQLLKLQGIDPDKSSAS